jgi:hypothetical protein
VIRLGWRLTVNGGRESAVRLVVTAAAVALGVGLLLISLAGVHALNAQNHRTAWLDSGDRFGPQLNPPAGPATGGDALWWQHSLDHYGTLTIDRVDVAPTGPHPLALPGIPAIPGPGQFYVSPALARLLRSAPRAELGDRFPGVEIGMVGRSALPAPNSLLVVVGHRTADLSANPRSVVVPAITTQPGHGAGGWDANKLQTILAVGALALLFPVLIFIGTATRLAAARREERFAAMRLVGATPRQVSTVAAVEASVAAFAGVLVGFGVFLLLRPVLTNVPFTGAPFAAGDLALTPADIALAALGVPAAAALAARVALRRVQISPLGVSRRVTPAAPRRWRLVPVLIGVAELAAFVVVGPPSSTGGQLLGYFSGCLLVMIGLVVAGPWFTMLGARIMARRTSRPATLIAGRRLADNPRGAFRAISGLILALFSTSVSVGVITTFGAYHGGASNGATRNTLVARFTGPAPVPSHLTGATVLHQVGDLPPVYVVSCSELVHTPAIGRCPPGVAAVTIAANLFLNDVNSQTRLATTTWPPAAVALQDLPVGGVVVETDGKKGAVERERTALELAFPGQAPPARLSEISAQKNRQTLELQQLTNVVMVVSLVVAGCSLAVSVTGGVTERKRPFSLLRLTGVPLGVLRRVVAVEAAAPLLVISVVAIAMGFLSAGLFLRAQLGESLQPPGLGFYVLVTAGLAASLAIIASTFPVIERITGPEVARNE